MNLIRGRTSARRSRVTETTVLGGVSGSATFVCLIQVMTLLSASMTQLRYTPTTSSMTWHRISYP